MTKAETQEIAALILRRRRQCLIHRYLYYVLSESIISDFEYDRMERSLKELVNQYPKIAAKVEYSSMCPSHTVGSSNLYDYPRQIEQIAQSVLSYVHARKGHD